MAKAKRRYSEVVTAEPFLSSIGVEYFGDIPDRTQKRLIGSLQLREKTECEDFDLSISKCLSGKAKQIKPRANC